MCGEHNTALNLKGLWLGSPPHVRGASACTFAANSSLGITPACAGSIARGQFKLVLSQDHPRMCGEH